MGRATPTDLREPGPTAAQIGRLRSRGGAPGADDAPTPPPTLLGHTPDGRPCHRDLSSLPNGHMLIVGASGEGKTNFAMWSMAQRLRDQHPLCMIVNDVDAKPDQYRAVIRHALAMGLEDKVISVDVARTGLPFALLRESAPIPDDILIENLLADLRAANSQIGNVQADRLRQLLLRGLDERWHNTELARHIRAIKDARLKAQLMPLLLLLRSDCDALDALLVRRMVRFDLSAFAGEPRALATFLILVLSRLFRHQKLLAQEGRQLTEIQYWVEEAATVRNAEAQLSALFRQGRKFLLQLHYITQMHEDVPAFVARNCATHVFFRSAVESRPDLARYGLPERKGEVLVRLHRTWMLVRTPRFEPHGEATSPEPELTESTAAEQAAPPSAGPAPLSQNSRLPRGRAAMRCIAVKTAATGALARLILRFWKACRLRVLRRWLPVVGIEHHDGVLLLDPGNGAPMQSLVPWRHTPRWHDLLVHLDAVMEALTEPAADRAAYQPLVRAGLLKPATEGDGWTLHPALAAPPVHQAPPLADACRTDGWAPLPNPPHIPDRFWEDLRAVAANIWGSFLPDEYSIMWLPVFVVMPHDGEPMEFSAWTTLPARIDR